MKNVAALLWLVLLAMVLPNFWMLPAWAAPEEVKGHFDLTQPLVFGTWAMLWLGQVYQFTTFLSKLEDLPNGPSFAWWRWVKTHPFTMIRQVIAGQIGYALLAVIPGQLTVASALAVGYCANDFATKAATRTYSDTGQK